VTDTSAAWPALAARGLGKAFGTKIAVAEVNIDVPRGSFFGIVGPNGAGKTTTLRMATGLLRPDRGQVWIDGIDVWSDPVAAKTRIGVLPEDLALFERLRGSELLEFHGLLRNMATDAIESRAGQLLDFLGLADTYSEKDLETAILRELQPFILELGAGFAFIDRQKRIVIDGEDFYIDCSFSTAGCGGSWPST